MEGFLLAGDPHTRAAIWDLAVSEKKGELYVLSWSRIRGAAEVQVFDRQGEYLRTIMPLNPTLPRSSVQDLCRNTAREGCQGTRSVTRLGSYRFNLAQNGKKSLGQVDLPRNFKAKMDIWNGAKFFQPSCLIV